MTKKKPESRRAESARGKEVDSICPKCQRPNRHVVKVKGNRPEVVCSNCDHKYNLELI